ncbi:MAG: hypothetical protein PHC53_04220 [Patescibacteria group bacterium]|nr:hypothetical protein [Patescibacteria group bacterium]
MNSIDPKLTEAEMTPEKKAEQVAPAELSSTKADEIAIEQTNEKEAPVLEAEKEKVGAAAVTAVPMPTQAQVVALEKDQATVEVENILEDGLKDIYGKLPDNLKPVFKQKGEETAQAISRMVKEASVKFGEIMKLILSWLKIIPGVNRFFLEQEAKIKADRIVLLTKQIEEDKSKITK